MSDLTKRGTPRLRQYPATRCTSDMPSWLRIVRSVERTPDGCWLWRRAITNNTGYGQLSIRGRVYKAHRVAYEAFVGPIPDGLHIDHLCRVRACVNPWHLEPVTPLENTRRGAGPVSRACCPLGHPYDEANTYRASGRRYCRLCQRTRLAIWKSMTPEERASRKAAGLPVVDPEVFLAALEQDVEAA